MKGSKQLLIQVPECLLLSISQIINVAFSILFALVFLTVYVPFSNTAWFHVGFSDRFIWTIVFIGVSTLFLAFSRLMMNLAATRLRHFLLIVYLSWLIFEIVFIGSFHAMISWFLIGMEDCSFSYIYLKSILVTLLALGVPYIITDLIILLRDTRRKLMVTNSDNVESDNEAMPEHSKIINIMDNNGNLKLSVKLDNLFYIKSEDNYINVFYLKKGEVASHLLRCKLQTIENSTLSSSTLMRCHRSYIVNISKASVLQNGQDGFTIDFDKEGLESVPVSKTYSAKIVKAFSER